MRHAIRDLPRIATFLLDEETAAVLARERDQMEKQLGELPHLSQVIRAVIRRAGTGTGG